MSTPTSDLQEGNRTFYDRISGVYDWLSDASERSARFAGVELLNVRPGESVLEVGFGTGNEILDLSKLVGPKGKVYGIDVSTGMLSVAQKKIDKETNHNPIELQIADARKLPYPDNSFDAAYSSFTLELFSEEDLRLVLSEIQRVLRKDGRLGAVSMAKVKPGEKASLLERTYVWMHRHFPHIVDCRPIDLPAILTGAGFHVLKEMRQEIWTMPVAIVLAGKQHP